MQWIEGILDAGRNIDSLRRPPADAQISPRMTAYGYCLIQQHGLDIARVVQPGVDLPLASEVQRGMGLELVTRIDVRQRQCLGSEAGVRPGFQMQFAVSSGELPA